MTKSKIEDMVNGAADYLDDHLSTYVTLANAGRTGYQAPAPKKIEVKAYIPDTGPFPYGMVNVDRVAISASGNMSQAIIATVSVNVCLAEANPDDLAVALVRYMDALVDLVDGDYSLGGVVDFAELTEIDKDALPADGKGFVMATLSLKSETAY